MLRTHKSLSIVMALCLCLALLAPVFVAPPEAQAAATYQAISVPTLSANSSFQSLGIIQVDLDNCAAVRAGDVLTVTFSSEVDLAVEAVAGGNKVPVGVAVTNGATATSGQVREVVVPANLPGGMPNGLAGTVTLLAAGGPGVPSSAAIAATHTTLDITFSAAGTTNPGRILIYLQGNGLNQGVNIGSIEGDVEATILGPTNGAFAMGNVTVGKVSDAGDCVATIKSAKTFGSNGGATDTIIITESTPGSLKKAGEANTVRLKLPNGFTWVSGAGTYNWGFAGAARGNVFLGVANPAAPVANSGDYMNIGGQIFPNASDPRILDIIIPANTTAATGSGQIRFTGTIRIDDAIAKEGDVEAHLYDTAGKINEADIVVAKYASYSVKLVEGEVKELIAGKADQKLGKFYIEEGIKESILANRSIKITLPQGVKWWGGYRDENVNGVVAGNVTSHFPTPTIKTGGAGFGFNDVCTSATQAGTQPFLVGEFTNGSQDEGRTIKFSTTALSTSKAKIEFDNLKVDISPDFTGDIVLKVSSDSGVNGEVKVASVKPRVELEAENVTNIRIGEQDQVLGDLIIKETKKENVALRNQAVWVSGKPSIGPAIAQGTTNAKIALSLPSGATWSAGYPKVEVTEGNLELDTAAMSKVFNAATGIHSIEIPVKSESTKPSTIKVTGMKATLNRTIPEGDFKVAVAGLAINETGGLVQIGAGVNQELPFGQYESNKAAVAKCITPAPNEGTTGAAAGQFKIGSNIYEVNGVSKIAGTAPYIKDGRTFVPVRYLGYALGVAEADVVWDEASQKVTLTKGDNVVELTIGSTTITVNGEALTMEVAPEITNDFTMLPARYVAEGLGYEVGWDPGSQTVLLSSK